MNFKHRLLRKTPGLVVVSCLTLSASGCMALFPIADFEETVEDDGNNPDGVGNGGGKGELCESFNDCLEWSNDQPVSCIEGSCTLIRSPECPAVIGKWRDDDAVLMGSFSSLSKNVEDSLTYRTFKLVLDSFDSNSWPSQDKSERPVAIVMCNSTAENETEANREKLRAGATHLIETLQVPAVIPFLLPTELGNLFQEFVSKPKRNVLFLNPGATTKALIDKNWKQLLWHTLGQPADYVPAYIAILKEMDSLAMERWNDVTETRIALVYDADGIDEAYRLSLLENPDFQAMMTAKEAADPPLFREFSLASGSSLASGISAAADNIVAFQPHIVLSLVGENVGSFMSYLELKWSRSVESNLPNSPQIARLPYFVFSPSATGVSKLKEHFSEINSFARLVDSFTMSRYLAVQAKPQSSPGLKAYQKEWAALYPQLFASQENLYDVVYTLLYAIQASGPPADIDGITIRDGLLRLLGDEDDTPIIVGKDYLSDNLHDLSQASEARFQLIGAMGPQSYNALTGVQRVRTVVSCVRAEGLAWDFFTPTHFESEASLVAIDSESTEGFHRECFGDFLAPANP